MKVNFFGAYDSSLSEIQLSNQDEITSVLVDLFKNDVSPVYVAFFNDDDDENDENHCQTIIVSKHDIDICIFIEHEIEQEYHLGPFKQIGIHGFESFEEAFKFCIDLKEGH